MFRTRLQEYEFVSAAPTTAAETRIGVPLRELTSIQPLAAEYTSNFSRVADLYAGDPTSSAAWLDAIKRAQQHPRRRHELAAVIRSQQQRRGAPAEAIAAAQLLEDDTTVAIVTGQQSGIFGGPLYTLLKAITTIQLARRMSAEHEVTVVPVFWAEGDDHDWAEVRAVNVLDVNHEPREIAAPDLPGAGERSVGALTLDEPLLTTLGELRESLAPTDFTDWLDSTLREAYRPGRGIATAFAALLDALLGRHGLVVFESYDPAAKALVADLYARELQFAGRTSSLASAAAEVIKARGHEPQVLPQPNSVALFLSNGGRRAIKQEDRGFSVGEDHFEAAALVRETVDHPERFSPNVLLRPVVQDALFPTICYVAGPSELAYLGQLRGVYEHFGVPMPLVYPRATATLLDGGAARFLSRYEVPIQDLRAQDESALNRLLQSQLPAEIEEALGAAVQQITRAMTRVIEVMPALDPTLAGAAKTTLGRMEHDLRTLQTKVVQAAKKRHETLRRQFTRAQTQIFPKGEPQERVLGVVFFLNRYGPALIDRLLEDLPTEMGNHWLLAI